jgi:arylsulfatase A-like enzyme
MTTAKRPNILFITADQWRGDCLGRLGHDTVKTPRLDAFAEDATTFAQHYTQASPCGPSRASLHTGLYLMNHRVCKNGTPLDARRTTVALQARRAGYDPMLFGYTDQAIDPRSTTPDDPRLTTYEGVAPGYSVHTYLPDHAKPWIDWLKTQGVTATERSGDLYYPYDWDGRAGPLGPGLEPPRFSAEQTETAFLVDRFMEYADEQGDSPWFAHMSFLRPHPPFAVPAPYNEMFDPADMPPPVRRGTSTEEGAQHPYLDFILERISRRQFVPGPVDGLSRDWDETDVGILRAIYYGMLAEVDAQFGRMVDYLREVGRYDDTIIVFGSDHGEMLGDHYMFGKHGYFDQSYSIPLIVRAPDLDAAQGDIVRCFTENVDVTPTLLDLIGLEPPHQCDGASLRPFLEGREPSNWRREAHWEFDFREVVSGEPEDVFGIALDDCQLTVLRGERFKYVHFAAQAPLLFDLERDPGEFENLAGDPAYRDVMLDCAQRMLSWRMRHADRMLTATHLTADGPYVRPVAERAASEQASM